MLKAVGKHHRFGHLLIGKSEPLVQIRVEFGIIPCFVRRIVRDVLERVGGGHGEACCLERSQFLKGVARGCEICTPDVAAVNHACHEVNTAKIHIARCRCGTTDEVKLNCLHTGGSDGGKRGPAVPVGKGQEHAGTNRRCRKIRPRASGDLCEFCTGGIQIVRNKRRLIHLDPRGTGARKSGEQLAVGGHNLIDPLQRRPSFRSGIRGFGQREVGNGANHDRASESSGGVGIDEALNNVIVGKRNRSIGADFRYEVVIVRIEPLGHFERGYALISSG